MSYDIVVRSDRANEYHVIGWIVTGSIYPMLPRIFVKLADAKRYAKDICKRINAEFSCPARVVIEWRTEVPTRCNLETSYTK